MTDMQPIQSGDRIIIHWFDENRASLQGTFLHKTDGLWYLTDLGWRSASSYWSYSREDAVIAINPLSPEILYIEKG